MYRTALGKSIQILVLLFLVIAGLYYGRPFFIPLAFGGLLSMLFLPICRWLESRGISRGLAALLSVLSLVIIIGAVVGLVTWQVTDFAKDVTNMEQKVQELVNKTRQFISQNFGLSEQQQDALLQSQQPSAAQQSTILSSLAGSFFGIIVNLILVLVYIFLFIYFRRHLKRFILLLVPAQQKENAQQILQDVQKVSQQYLTGLGGMIVCLWVLYSIGFSIAGLKNAIFFAILCGLLEIIPFIGNLTGSLIAALMAFTQGGGMPMVTVVIITYLLIQFIQTYILEPLIVGSEVNINPLFTIVVLVIGELLWGIPGMVLAIPLTGIIKILCDHIEPLKPYGFLIGENKSKKKGWTEKLKGWFKKK
ncbi:MAG TPA: AI-2E family transporter [Chitinophagaceae bacterium]|nr:AI-2E family transporter [Chitinophagaceae bacterium]